MLKDRNRLMFFVKSERSGDLRIAACFTLNVVPAHIIKNHQLTKQTSVVGHIASIAIQFGRYPVHKFWNGKAAGDDKGAAQ